METFVEILSNLPDLYYLTAASEESVREAERVLNVIFSKDYRAYVLEYGVASASGHEFTGVCKPMRLNVVNVTLAQRKINPDIEKDWYVIEEANIDGIVIWQTASGEIYQTQPGFRTEKIADSLKEYIMRNIE